MHTSRLNRLTKNLVHDDPSKRRSAAEDLSEGDERAVYPLIKALRDDNFGVQDAAMQSLMQLKGESTAYMVIPLLRENSFLRNTAIVILREIGEETIPLLRGLLEDKDDDVRKFALDLIHDIEFCDYPDEIAHLLKDDPNANVRAAAAKTIGKLRYEKALPQLISALKDEEWVCFSALEALINLSDERAIAPIVENLKNPSDAVRFAAIETLGKIGSPEAEKPLIKHLSKKDEFEKRAVITSLVNIGSVPSRPDVTQTLLDMLKDGEWDEIMIAIKGLLALKEKSSVYQMIDIAGSLDISIPDNEEKIYFIKDAVRNFGCNNFLIDILKDKKIKFRGMSIAIDIIGDLQCKRAVPHLVSLLKNEYRDVKRSAINSLGKIADDSATECLIDSITEHDSHVRKTSVVALGKIGVETAFEPLMKMLKKEKYNDVIEEFITSLLNINSKLFLSRTNELDPNTRETAERFASDLNMEVTC